MRYIFLVLAALLVLGCDLANFSSISASVAIPTNTNIDILSLTTSSQTSALIVTQGSQVTLTALLENTGVYASGNIIVNLSITGPSSAGFTETVPALSPSQNEIVSITLSNATAVDGSSNVSFSANYLVGNMIDMSNIETSVYTVASPSNQIVETNANTHVPLYLPLNVPLTLNYTSANLLLEASSVTSNTLANVMISNVTSEGSFASIQLPSGAVHSIVILNISEPNTAKVAVSNNAIFGYPCGSLSPTPYKLIAGAWSEITPFTDNSASCTLTFSIPSDPVIAVFISSNVPKITTGTNTNAGSGGTPPSPAELIKTLPQLFINTLPLLSGIVSGSAFVRDIEVKNTGLSPETVSISAPSGFSKFVNVSSSNLLLSQGQSVSVPILLTAPKGASPGTYIIPIEISTNTNGQTASQTEYITATIVQNSTSEPIVLNQISLTNNTNEISGVVEMTAPPNQSIQDFDVRTYLPIHIAKNISDISAVGITNNISIVNNNYVIDWKVYSLPAGESVSGYYTIRNLQNQSLIQYSQTLFVLPSKSTPSQVLKILSVNIPPVYNGSTGTITVEALYTGTKYGPVSFTLGGPTISRVINASQYINATPNSNIVVYFGVKPSLTGTLPLSLYASAEGYNITYPVPVLVLPVNAQSANKTAAGLSAISIPKLPYATGILIVVVIAVIAITAFVRSRSLMSGVGIRNPFRKKDERLKKVFGIVKQASAPKEPEGEGAREANHKAYQHMHNSYEKSMGAPEQSDEKGERLNRLKHIEEDVENQDKGE